MGFLGIGGDKWKSIGKWALRAAPIVAAPFTGGASLLAIGAGSGALSGALGGGGWKGAALGGGLGLIPGGGGVGSAAGGVAKAGLKQGLTQVGKKLGTQAALDVGTKLGGKYAGGAVGSALAGGVGSALTGGGLKGFGKGAAQGVKEGLPQTALDVGSNVYSNALGGGGGNTLVAGNYGGGTPYDMRQTTAPTGGGKTTGGPGGSAFAQQKGAGGGGFDWNKWGPVITQGAGAVVGGVAASKAQKNALKRSPEEQLALAGSQDVAGTAGKVGGQLLNQSKPYIEGPANYYQALLRGNRAAMTQAVAPGIAQVTGAYRGAQSNLNQAGVRGAQRGHAAGELARAQASQIAGLTTGVQPYAAEQLSQLGTNVLGQVNPLLGTAGNIYNNLLTGGQSNREQAARRGKEAGEAWGGLVRDVGEAIPGGKKNPRAPKPAKPGPEITPQVGGMIPGAQNTPLEQWPQPQAQLPDYGGWNTGGRRQTSPGGWA